MNELIKIGTNEHGEPRISGRELHTFLEVKTAYKDWFPRMTEYGFTEGEDFNPLKIARVQNEGGREVSREVIDHSMTIDLQGHPEFKRTENTATCAYCDFRMICGR